MQIKPRQAVASHIPERWPAAAAVPAPPGSAARPRRCGSGQSLGQDSVSGTPGAQVRLGRTPVRPLLSGGGLGCSQDTAVLSSYRQH